MVASEFLSELKQIHESFEWHLVEEDRWVVDRRRKPRFAIRATHKSAPQDTVFDPIGALCYIRTGQIFGLPSWLAAANAIGLSLIDAADLIAASDNRIWRRVDGHREPDPYLPALRRRLASTVSVSDEPGWRLQVRSRWLRLWSRNHDRNHRSVRSTESA